MAEVHVIGQIIQAKDFPKQNLFCKWYLQIGNNWKVISGKKEGQTQVTASQLENVCKWSFPIDIHLATAGLQGWPKIYLQVYHLDWLGRSHIFGYGFITVPTAPGTHILDCYTWRPFGSIKDRFVQYFLGGGFQIKNPDLIFSSGERFKLSTEAMGVVSFELCVILRASTTPEKIESTTVSALVTSGTEATLSTPASLLINVTEASCKDNSSCSFNSSKINFTTISPQTENLNISSGSIKAPTEILPEKQKHTAVISDRDICICDLKVAYCDVNCCCDRDCSLEDKLVFGHCEQDFHHYDTRLCEYEKHIYINNTLHIKQIDQPGLFCVVRKNLPSSYIIQKSHPLKSLSDVEFQKLNKYAWPEMTVESSISFSPNSYTYGKSLWIIQNNFTTIFQIPKSFISENCLMKENVKYLIDNRNSCSHKEISADSIQLKAETYFKNMLIIGKPQQFNLSLYEKNSTFQKCPRNICLVIEPRICKNHFEDCIRVSKNSTDLEISCHLNVISNMYSCSNLVQHLKYVFYHNGTNGIEKIDLLLILKNVSYFFGKDTHFIQEFEVIFMWSNHSLNYSSHLSGSPGYLIGKPILSASLISQRFSINNTNSSVSNSTNYITKLKLFRNPTDFTNNFIVLPDTDNYGRCILTKNRYLATEFGYNMYSKCTIEEYIINNKNISSKEICIAIQTIIFKYWSINNITNATLSNKFIGLYGNANVHNKDDWLQVMFERDLMEVINKTWGEIDLKRQVVKCGNITTALAIEVFHSRVDFKNILNQEKILATTFQFSNFKNITFPFKHTEKFINFSVRINTQVTFYDITTKKIRKLVDPPSLAIKLPHDFFYPFVKVDNNTANLTTIYFVHLYLCCIILFCVK